MGTGGGVERTLAAVRSLYASNLAEHGLSSKSVGWRDEQSQRLRFEKLATALDGDAGTLTVNDWGCGYGAMFQFLASRLGDRLTGYRGYDISSEMIEAGRRTISDPRCEFALGEESSEADYTFVSGTFNVRFEATDEQWEGWIRDTLARLFAASRRGLAFNLLSTYVDWREPHLFYGNPRDFFDFCKQNLSPRVALLHDYPLFEWTIVVRR